MIRSAVVLRGFVLVAVLAILPACAQPPVPQDRYYRLDVASPGAAGIVLDGVVEIDRLSAEGVTSGRAIVYTDGSQTALVREFFYDFWAEPPSVMIRDSLVAYLRDAGIARAIVTPEARAEADYNLSGRIGRFELTRGGEPKGVVDIELTLTNARTGRLLLVQSYALGVGASDASVAAGVAAINQGVAAIFERFVSDLRRGG